MNGPRRNDDDARPTVWVCVACEQTYKTRAAVADSTRRTRQRYGACLVCIAKLKTKRRTGPARLGPELHDVMERLGRRIGEGPR
ncbi:MAG: hypothetical protein ACE5JG_11955 [Planctomycetota bacterium]